MRWDFQQQCSIPFLSTCFGHRNNFACTTLVASSCYLHRHNITFIFNVVFVFSVVLTLTVASSSLRSLRAYYSTVCSQRMFEWME